MTGTQERDGDTSAMLADLVRLVVRERTALRIDLAALENMARSTGHAALVQRVGSLRSGLREQLNLLDALLDIVATDEPG